MSKNYCLLNNSECINNPKKEIIKKRGILFKNDSFNKNFLNYENLYCEKCSIISLDPLPDKDALSAYYREQYRKNELYLKLDDNEIYEKFNFSWVKYSFHRFKNFFSILKKNNLIDVLGKDELFIDYGGYSGVFANNVRKFFDCKVMNFERDEQGKKISKNYFGIETPDDFLENSEYIKNVKILSFIHSFEHIENPVIFLQNISTVMKNGSFIYIEVPNSLSYPLCNPTHLHMFNEVALNNVAKFCNLEVVDAEIHGYPKLEYISDNEFSNISILLKKSSEKTKNNIVEVKTKKFIYQITINYFKVTNKILFQNILQDLKNIIKNFIKIFLNFLYFFK